MAYSHARIKKAGKARSAFRNRKLTKAEKDRRAKQSNNAWRRFYLTGFKAGKRY